MQDSELLAEYVRSRSPAAFAELTARYVNLVYSAAARQTGGDRHLAEDVTQGVFLVLAQKADTLRRETALAAWLLKVTRFAAIDAAKAAGRRRKHEERAAGMRNEADPSNGNDASKEASWDEVRGVLDDAVDALPERDRRAVVLRYFEQCSVDEVARRMAVTPEAARQRIFRAIGKLRGRLARHGVAVSAVALGTFLGAHSVEAAPAGLAASTAALAAAGGAGGSAVAAYGIAKGTVTVMAWTKVKATAAMILTAALTVGGTAAVVATVRAGGGNASPRAAAPGGGAVAAANGAGVTGFGVGGPGGAGVVGAPAGKPWWPAFHAAYGLAPGQVVKLVPKPFIPERWDYWRTQQPRTPALKPGEQMIEKSVALAWDGRDYNWQSASTVDTNLSSALQFVVGLKRWEIAGEGDAFLDIPGDWVFDARATRDQKLAGVEAAVSKALGRTIHVTKKTIRHEVVVARGEFVPNGPVDDRGRHILEFGFGDRPTGPLAQLMPEQTESATVRGVFDRVEDLFRLPVIDESGSGTSRLMLRSWRGPTKLTPAQQLDLAIESLSERTGLTLSKEQREITVWEGTAEAK